MKLDQALSISARWDREKCIGPGAQVGRALRERINELDAQCNELLAALKMMRARHQIDDPHHAHLCEFCRAADAAINNAEGK